MTDVARPWEFSRHDWKQVLVRVWSERADDDVSTRAAAIAYSALFAVPTLLVAVVSLYGILASPSQIEDLIAELRLIAPNAMVELLGDQLRSLGRQSDGALTLGVISGAAGAVWSVSGGVGRLRSAINEVFEEEDQRPWYVKRLVAVAVAMATIVFITISVGLITAVPTVLDALDIEGSLRMTILSVRWLLLGLMMVSLIAVLFRYGPDRRPPAAIWSATGTILAAVAWVVMSFGFSVYTENFASYNETFGSIGAVIVFMTWLYLSAYILLLAAELNAEMEHQTVHDTTVDPERSIGDRGAFVADDVPEGVADTVASGSRVSSASSGGEQPSGVPPTKEITMASISNPFETDEVVGVLPADNSAVAVAEATDAGFKTQVLHGRIDADEIDVDGDDGMFDRVLRFFQEGEQRDALEKYHQRLLDGDHVVRILAVGDREDVAGKLLAEHGGELIWHFGQWTYKPLHKT